MAKTLACLLLLLCLYPAPTVRAAGAAQPAWWEQAQVEAKDNGYRLMGDAQVDKLLASDGDFLLLDVRPDYEFKRGHLPGASNLEFHLGDRLKLSPQKAEDFKRLAGPNKARRIVIYCRSFK